METKPLFSICHTTARPEGWKESFGAWCTLASHHWPIEYVLCVDRRWGFTAEMVVGFKRFAESEYPDVPFNVVWNNGRKCSVDGWNFAAAASTGNILILNADDFFPPKHWDIALEDLSCSGPGHHGYQPEFVIQVSSGIEVHDSDNLMTLGIISRDLYERWGYALYPGFESVRSDDDFSDHARFDGVVIDGRHLLFEHRHPAWSETKDSGVVEMSNLDPVYRHQNKDLNYAEGLRLLKARRASDFTETPKPRTKVIATCTPGDSFPMEWVMCWHQLQSQILLHGYGLGDSWGYSNNIYMTRGMMHAGVVENLKKFDYVLWIDHDNLIFWEHLEKLIQDLEEYPEISMVAGWYYLSANGSDLRQLPEVRASVGMWINDEFVPLPISDLESAGMLKEVDCVGFGCVLMRAETMLLAGPKPWTPRVSNKFDLGLAGDDISFCLNLKERGGKILVDNRVRVEHLKRMPVMYHKPETILPEAGQFEERKSQSQ